MTTEILETILIENIPKFADGLNTISYEEAGIFTYDRGLVVSTANGDEFQLTLIQSR